MMIVRLCKGFENSEDKKMWFFGDGITLAIPMEEWNALANPEFISVCVSETRLSVAEITLNA